MRVVLALVTLAGSAAAGCSAEQVSSTSAAAASPTMAPEPTTTAADSPGPTTHAPGLTDPAPTAPVSRSLSPMPDGAAVYLSGPFGTLDGIATTGHWPPAAALRSVETVVRSAPLVVGLRDADIGMATWAVRVAPADAPSDGSAELLAEGPAAGERTDLFTIDGPDAGEWILRADITPAVGPAAAYHWSLAVPDRPLPSSGILEVAPPGLLVSTSGAEVSAELGSSCYVYTCGDVPRPPAERLPKLVLGSNDDMELSLSDASGIVAWTVSAWPAGDRDGADAVELDRGEDALGTTSITVAAPPAGDRVVEIDIVFDLERGSATYYLRTVVT